MVFQAPYRIIHSCILSNQIIWLIRERHFFNTEAQQLSLLSPAINESAESLVQRYTISGKSGHTTALTDSPGKNPDTLNEFPKFVSVSKNTTGSNHY